MLHKQLTKVPTEPSNITVSETYITFRTSLVTKGWIVLMVRRTPQDRMGSC